MAVTLKNCTETITLNNGTKIPVIGLGTYLSKQNEVYEAVVTAAKAGYRHVDTAAFYKNEEQVGKAVKDCGVPRSEMYVTTKVWPTELRDPEAALDKSLKRLGLEYIDLYLMHWPVTLKTDTIKDGELMCIPRLPDGNADVDKDWTFVQAWEAMQKLLKSGKVKSIGVSNFSINNIKELLAAPTTTVVPVVNQVEVQPLLPNDELIEFCRSKDIITQAYCPFGGSEAPLIKDATVVEIAKGNGVDAGQVITSWHVQRGYVVLPKSVKESRIISNLKTFTLSDADMTKMNNISKTQGEKRLNNVNFSPFPIFE
ncbi:hypothetical protein TBLA_0A02835 [Henningerozyma blattae CBS 6284]|uniref:NADP-dependent oxidoreductase domain-containing protein n=1 Tax=Henningerozyma blattae (strain ATCC 34711 / CBS 6284 / DSM 70876 / NBRC 10599 / NRRL Y-10934 / UCD 77-7) TaxID=1071380 RepID=I2GVD0_HENB6|nr:hypothetical protein TBLA_0A02835 [Tetrapisispora blattae CBS 6284]CCH58082.1 hypothetical protein TBLA_0A02835 [Tetrapisispora blattae CBS 6284]